MRRLDNVDIRLLRVFVALVEAGGFSDAQIALNLSQSTLSTHLADLEKRVGGPLCVRARKSFRLTDLGRATYEATRKLLADIEDFRYRIATVNGRLTGRLRLGVVDGVITSRELGLQHAMNRMLKPDFDVFIDLIQATPLELEQAVAEGGRDVVIGPFSQRAPGVVYKPICREQNSLYCGRHHPLFAILWIMRLNSAQIERARLSVRGYRQLDDLYRIGHPKAAASVLQMEAQAMLILSGQFVGFLPHHMAAPWIARDEMRAIQMERYAFISQHFVAYRQTESERPLIRTFVSALDEHLQHNPPDPV